MRASDQTRSHRAPSFAAALLAAVDVSAASLAGAATVEAVADPVLVAARDPKQAAVPLPSEVDRASQTDPGLLIVAPAPSQAPPESESLAATDAGLSPAETDEKTAATPRSITTAAPTDEPAPAVETDAPADAALSVSPVSNEVMALLKRIAQEEEEVTKQFSVFQMGDKDSYSHDERGMTAIRDALSASETLGQLKLIYLRAKAGHHTLSQTYNVLRKLKAQLGHTDRLTYEIPIHPPDTAIPPQYVKEISTPDSVIPSVTWRDLAKPEDAEARFRALLKGAELAKDAGCRNTKSNKLQLDKILRADVLRNAQWSTAYAQKVIEEGFTKFDFTDPDLVNVLDLYAKSWTNLAPTW